MSSLQVSGAISFSTLRNFFGITNEPFKFSYLYNKLQSFPISGSISLSNCYGKSKIKIYTFSSLTFTNASATGANGPTLANVQSAYSLQSWTQNTNYLDVNNGKQLWKIPNNGNYTFIIAGAGTDVGNGGIIFNITKI